MARKFALCCIKHRIPVAGCTHPDVKRMAIEWATLPLRDWEYRCGPAVRINHEVCQIPAFRYRCIPTFDLGAFLNAGGVLIISGESKGNLRRPDLAFLMGMILLNVIRLARSGQLKRLTRCIIDEGVNASILDRNTARGLSETAKWNLEFDLIIQNPTSLLADMRDSIFQNCDVIEFFKQVSPAFKTGPTNHSGFHNSLFDKK